MSEKSIYILGIKGQSTTAVAQIARASGAIVRGADSPEVFVTDKVLFDLGIQVDPLEDAVLPPDVETLVYSPAYSTSHPLIVEARRRELSVLQPVEFFVQYATGKRLIAIAGTHGKTTTTGLLGSALGNTPLDPTVIAGFVMPQWGGNIRFGQGDIVVLEADEYKHKLRLISPHVLVLPSVDHDHVDIYPTQELYLEEFKQCIERLPVDGLLIYNADDPRCRELAAMARVRTVGVGIEHGEWRLELRAADHAVLHHQQYGVQEINLHIWGEMNLLNAALAFVCGRELGGGASDLAKGLKAYLGAARRQQIYLQNNDLVVLDDFAHHPREVVACLTAVRARYPDRRIILVFQPHTRTRTEAFGAAFHEALRGADQVVLLDIYTSAREQGDGQNLESFMQLEETDSLHHLHHLEDAYQWIVQHHQVGDVIVTMGAGDVGDLAKKITQHYE